MGIWGWVVLLAISAAIATAGQFLFFSRDRRPNDYDWVYMAGGALIGGFTGHAWYPGIGPTFDGFNVVPALLGALVGAILVEIIYRLVLRPRQR
jgi:cytochrome c biogenesis protein CcdA